MIEIVINFKSETEVYTENRRLRAELEQLQDEINKQQIKVLFSF